MKKFLSMTLAAVMCFCAFGCAPDTSNDGGMKTVDQILKETSAEDLKCEEYDLGKYTAPYYDSQIIYNETVMFVENDGAFAEKKLMYKPGKILEVRSYDLKTLYKENVDYTVTENGIMRTPNSSMPYLTEDDFYVDEPGNANTAFASISREGQFCKYDEGIYFPFHQVAVTYIHTEEYYGPEVTASGKMSNVVAKLKNKENLTFVFYGDSLMADAIRAVTSDTIRRCRSSPS